MYAECVLKTVEEDRMVDGVKGRRKIKKGKKRNVSRVS
jgi:hypothetical protein